MILKQNTWIFPDFIVIFSTFVNEGKFSNILKQVNITPNFKKGNRGSKKSYRPLSILPVIAKIFRKPHSEKKTLLMGGIYFEMSVWFSEEIYGTALPVRHVSNGQLTVVKHLEHFYQIFRKLLTACYMSC